MSNPLTKRDLEFGEGDRLRKSLIAAGMSVQEMAAYLEVRRETVSAWINGARPASKQTKRLWALRTGAPLLWIESGVWPSNGPDGLPGLDSNQEPIDLKTRRRVLSMVA